MALLQGIIWLFVFKLSDEKGTILTSLGILCLVPTIFLGLMKVIAYFKMIFVDLFGIAYLVGYTLALVTLSLTDWI